MTPPLTEEQVAGLLALLEASNEPFVPPEIVLCEYDVTCETPDCENEGVSIRVTGSEEEPTVQCGPCGATITSVEKA